MNDKDEKAFEDWYGDKPKNYASLYLQNKKAWQAACEYKQKEIDEVELREIKVNRSFVELADKYCKLHAENKKLREALEFTLKAAEYLFQPDKDLPKGLFPTSYHTLSYEGDLSLIEKCKKAREALKEVEEK